MTDLIVPLITNYGVLIVGLITFLSCLALPVPSSLVMLTAGAFSATGDLVLISVLAAAFAGAVLGDNSGYWIARISGQRLSDWIHAHPKRSGLMQKGEGFMTRWGGSSVFFSCWLVAPLGPYINYVSGLTRFDWPRFALWGIAGEVVWVGLYVTLGYQFGSNMDVLSGLLSNLSGFLVAILFTLGLGWALFRPKPAAMDK